MALPDQLADLERKVSARWSAALAEIREETRRAVEAQAQRASSALLQDLDAIRPKGDGRLLVAEDLLESTRAAEGEARRALGRSLRQALVAFDGARSQSSVLEALLGAAQPFGDRAALWLMRPSELSGWASRGFAGGPNRDPIAGGSVAHASSPALARLSTGRGCVLLGATEAAGLARVLDVAAPARALLVPLVLRDRIAAVLYVDAVATGEFEVEALQLLTHSAAQRLELQALATRTYTPTLFLEDDAPANEGGLALWDPAAATASAESAPSAPAMAAATPASAAVAASAYTWESSAAEVTTPIAEETAAEVAELADDIYSPVALDEPTLVESVSTVVDAPAAASPADATVDEISWQMEEADETALLGAAPSAPEEPAFELLDLPASAPAESAWAAAAPALSGTPTHEIPFAPPAAASEWREVDEATAPHSTLSAAATQRFATPGATNEFPQSMATADFAAPAASPLIPASPLTPMSGASTIAFVPPKEAVEGDMAEDATLRIQRSALQPPPLPVAPTAVPPPAVLGGGLHDDEPTVARGRTTEVAPPTDLQGPGWAFSSVRSPRSSGDNALHEEARRLARLLVSEIKLYNEDQVEEGRHNRDIYHRLKDDIDRSRQIYEERVHESVRGTTDYFQQELIRSLAGGDPRALGI
jgi:hypothetical protein